MALADIDTLAGRSVSLSLACCRSLLTSSLPRTHDSDDGAQACCCAFSLLQTSFSPLSPFSLSRLLAVTVKNDPLRPLIATRRFFSRISPFAYSRAGRSQHCRSELAKVVVILLILPRALSSSSLSVVHRLISQLAAFSSSFLLRHQSAWPQYDVS